MMNSDNLRVTYYGNRGTIYSIIQNNESYDNSLDLKIGDWIHPYNDEIIECLVEAMYELCSDIFLENEEIYRISILNAKDVPDLIESNNKNPN